MKMSRMVVPAVIACLAGCSGAPRAMTLDRLVAANTTARGGAAAIGNVRSVAFELQITEPQFTVTGHYVATRDGFMRIDILAGGERVYTEALGPDGAWQMRKGETHGAPESAAGVAALRRGIVGNLYSLGELEGLGYSLIFHGARAQGGKEYWALETVAPDGFSETLYLDKDSRLVSRKIDTSALHPDIDAAKKRFETLEMDYRPTAGVEFARRTEKRNLDTGELVQTVVVESVTVNPAVDESIFRRP